MNSVEPTLRLLSLGAGVQSTTLALMACRGDLDAFGKLDGAVFADTGWEPRRVYEHLDRLEVELTRAGIPLYRVSVGNIRDDMLDSTRRFAALPYFVRNPDGTQGMGRRQCTHEYKLKPIGRKVRELLGATAPDFRSVRRGRVAEQWIGFSTDEIHRVTDRRKNLYTTQRFPLLELGMSRKDCARWLRSAGWDSVAKSACIGCPFHGNQFWRDLRDNHPDEWADAVDFDRRVRKGGAHDGRPALPGEAFLHRSMLPLDIAPIELSKVHYLLLADQYGMTVSEMAEVIGMSDSGVRSILGRAKSGPTEADGITA